MKNEEEENLVCPGCSGRKLKKLISRVVYHISEQDRLNTYDPAATKSDSFYRDSRNINRWALIWVLDLKKSWRN
jgi:hypothetical protein